MSEPGSENKAGPPRSTTGRPAARLFFALWPDHAAREPLSGCAAALYRACGGRRIRDEQLHLTLAFLGDVLVMRLPDAIHAASLVSGQAFRLRFSRPGYWPRKRVVWVAPDETPDRLAALAEELTSALKQAGFGVEERPYVPHVTLLRDARCYDLPDRLEAFEWNVEDFALVRSTLLPSGSRYEVIGSWALGKP